MPLSQENAFVIKGVRSSTSGSGFPNYHHTSYFSHILCPKNTFFSPPGHKKKLCLAWSRVLPHNLPHSFRGSSVYYYPPLLNSLTRDWLAVPSIAHFFFKSPSIKAGGVVSARVPRGDGDQTILRHFYSKRWSHPSKTRLPATYGIGRQELCGTIPTHPRSDWPIHQCQAHLPSRPRVGRRRDHQRTARVGLHNCVTGKLVFGLVEPHFDPSLGKSASNFAGYRSQVATHDWVPHEGHGPLFGGDQPDSWFAFSLEKRIKPRYGYMMAQGRHKGYKLSTLLNCNDERFAWIVARKPVQHYHIWRKS